MEKRVIDVACGSKMFWFDKDNPDVEFCDKRAIERQEYYPGRYIEISPDTVCDFTALPFPDGAYKLAVFDPAAPQAGRRKLVDCYEIWRTQGRLERNAPKGV